MLQVTLTLAQTVTLTWALCHRLYCCVCHCLRWTVCLSLASSFAVHEAALLTGAFCQQNLALLKRRRLFDYIIKQVTWLTPVLYDSHQYYMTYTSVIWLTPVLYDLHQCYMIYTSVIWFTPVLYDLHQCYMIYTSVIWLTPVSSFIWLNQFWTKWVGNAYI